MIVKGKSKWAFIKTPNTTFEPKYTINVYPEDEDVLNGFKEQGYPVKTDKVTGEEYIEAKRKVVNRKGDRNPVPKLKDADLNDVDVQVGNGSYVAVQMKPWVYDIGGQTYKGFELQGVQVLELIEYSGDGDEFEKFDAEASEF